MSKPQEIQYGKQPAANPPVAFGNQPAASEYVESVPVNHPQNSGVVPTFAGGSPTPEPSGDDGSDVSEIGTD